MTSASALAPTLAPTLAGTLWPVAETRAARLGRALLLAFAGSLLLTLSAKVQVPFWPVPMTMQTFAVLVLGMSLGWRLGMATVLLYLAEGALGLPIFAGTPERGLGLAYMAGPTGGYLVGFVLAAGLVGRLGEAGWDRGVLTTLAANALGTAVIFGCGFLWLSALIGAESAFTAGVVPFLPGAALKIALAAACLPLAWKLLKR
ncbi:biotin transporter BioY [Roseospirillum parvum]|uniref:Biotin transporter n=1 Tax=Roseospirillum parvum TaxID=83401 RepID=A0A1G7ZCY9_9PROT|nr:biotin transporter BioY [Roseospirillum parvum]SDH06611.1 biotin transport system substrate-specific component [Roseospirillum parvum]